MTTHIKGVCIVLKLLRSFRHFFSTRSSFCASGWFLFLTSHYSGEYGSHPASPHTVLKGGVSCTLGRGLTSSMSLKMRDMLDMPGWGWQTSTSLWPLWRAGQPFLGKMCWTSIITEFFVSSKAMPPLAMQDNVYSKNRYASLKVSKIPI